MYVSEYLFRHIAIGKKPPLALNLAVLWCATIGVPWRCRPSSVGRENIGRDQLTYADQRLGLGLGLGLWARAGLGLWARTGLGLWAKANPTDLPIGLGRDFLWNVCILNGCNYKTCKL